MSDIFRRIKTIVVNPGDRHELVLRGDQIAEGSTFDPQTATLTVRVPVLNGVEFNYDEGASSPLHVVVAHSLTYAREYAQKSRLGREHIDWRWFVPEPGDVMLLRLRGLENVHLHNPDGHSLSARFRDALGPIPNYREVVS
jgi:hypothetical protein